MDDKMLITELPFKAKCVNTYSEPAKFMDLTTGALQVGRVYTIVKRKIGGFSTAVWTEELGSGEKFNSVHFEVVE